MGGVSINQVLALELIAAGTSWQGDFATTSAVETLFDGSQWMIYRNAKTDALHWDIVRQRIYVISRTVLTHTTSAQSTIGRMISFPVADGQ